MIDYFTDPILRAPTLGCMLMCLAAALMGVVIFLKKRSLLGESLSHAAYPGVVLGMAFCAALGANVDGSGIVFALLGALFFSALGLGAIEWLEKKAKVPADAALCYMLASFFGFGVLAASWLQGAYPSFSRQVQIYLYGQAATMTDIHIAIYGSLALLILLFIVIFYRPLQAMLFDSAFSGASGVGSRFLSSAVFLLFLLSVIISIRSVGVILMSGMLIAPVVAARQLTDRLSHLFFWAGLIGIASGWIGNYASVEGSMALAAFFPGKKLSLPTGPMIVLASTVFAVAALCFSPKRGLLSRLFRILCFRMRCVEENILKAAWKKEKISLCDLKKLHHLGRPVFYWLLFSMRRQGWLSLRDRHIALTSDGKKRASRIVRLHRLWDVYLTDLGWPDDKVHSSAEEMEHILTSEFGERLSLQLSNPRLDPHDQPIPEDA